MIVIISLILLAVSLAVIFFIILRHISELRILNVEAVPQAREKKVKALIFAKRLERIGNERFLAIKRKLSPLRAFIVRIREKFHKRLHELELAYLKAKQLRLGSRGKRTAQIMSLLREANELEKAEKLEEAERKYISIVSLDSRNVDAYEGLGNLYLKQGKYAESREALGFILKFRPNDASVHVSIGESYLNEGKAESAIPEFKKAVDIRSANPKYLDFYIESAILVGDAKNAFRGLELMRRANPENQKILDWEKRINAIEENLPT